MILSAVSGSFLALAAAFVWGSADFCGGLAARKAHVFQVLTLSSFYGILLLIACLPAQPQTQISLNSLIWAAASGISGAIGLAIFYYGLSLGNTVAVAPTAAVVGAVLPVAFGILTQGLPGKFQIAGFGFAFLGIALVTRSPSSNRFSSSGSWIGVVAGVFFSGFFICIRQVEEGEVLFPLLISRAGELLVALILLFALKLPLPSVRKNAIAILTGILDAGGSILYLFASQFARLDVTVVLSSLYPAVTVYLAYLMFKEKFAIWQLLGVILCLAAVIFIAL